MDVSVCPNPCLSTSPCASTGVIAGLVPPSARLEIDVVAVIPDE